MSESPTTNFIRHTIKGDGNCLFNALLHQMSLYLPNHFWKNHFDIRNASVNFIRTHYDRFSHQLHYSIEEEFNTVITPDNKTELFEKYLQRLLEDGFWGGVEIIVCVCELLDVTINVYSVGHDRPVSYSSSSDNNTIFSLSYNGSHYDSLIPIRIDFKGTEDEKSQSKVNNTETSQDSNTSLKLSIPSNIESDTQYLRKIKCFKDLNKEHLSSEFKIGTWNIRGINKPCKQKQLDTYLTKNDISVLAIQETNMPMCNFSSENFNWYLGNKKKSTRRGIGLLINKNREIQVKRVKCWSGNIIKAHLEMAGIGNVVIFSVYIPPFTSKVNQRSAQKIFSTLCFLINSCRSKTDVYVLGDFNAHLGREDTVPGPHLGNVLFHKVSNENGFFLDTLAKDAKLNILTSRKRINCLTTWTRRTQMSSIDHILCKSQMNSTFHGKVKGINFMDNFSDHRLIFISIKAKLNCNLPQKSIPSTSSPPISPISKKEVPYDFKALNFKLFNYPKNKEAFQTLIDQELTKIKSTKSRIFSTDLIKVLQKAAKATLISRTPLTPRRRRALAAFKKSQFRLKKQPCNPVCKMEVNNARKRLLTTIENHKTSQCENFFANIENTHHSSRLMTTFKFLKSFNKRSSNASKSYIPMSQWEDELKTVEGDWTPLLHNDYCPIGPPPSFFEVSSSIDSMKSGTTPGTDKTPIELFKNASLKWKQEFHSSIVDVWLNNNPPKRWIETVQVPIPKKPSPKTEEIFVKSL